MIVTCSQANAHDLNRINALMYRSKAHWGYDEAFMSKFMRLFQMTPDYLEKNTVKLLYALDNVVGFYSFIVSANEAELDNFFIDPDYIGKGFGKKIWSFMVDDFKSQGVSRFIIWSDSCAEPFYMGRGCIKIGIKKSPMMPERYPVVFEYAVSLDETR